MSRDALALPDKVFIVMPPVSVASDVQEMTWSPSGRSLLFRTSDAALAIQQAADSIAGKIIFEGEEEPFKIPQANLGVYSPATGKVRWASNFPKNVQISTLYWVSETTVLVDVSRFLPDEESWSTDQEFLIFSTDTGKVAPPQGAQPRGSFVDVKTDPSTGLTLLLAHVATSTTTSRTDGFILDSTGRVVAAPPAVREALEQEWRPVEVVPGRGIVFIKQAGDGTAKRLLNPRLTFEAWTAEFQEPKPPMTPGVLSHVEGALGDTLTLVANQAQTSVAPVVVCQQVELSSLAPGFDAIAYTSQRTLWIRPIASMDAAEYARRLALEQRFEIERNARMIGFALMSYLANHEDQFPTGDPAAAIAPYLPKKRITDGFVFTLPNARGYEDLKDPETTEVGYFKGEGGRFVVYANTFVKWVPDK